MAESKRSSTTTTSSASTTNSSASSSSKSSRKSKNDLIRSVVGSYLKQRNYMITDRFRRSDLILTQSTEQIVMNSAIRNEISKANSFLFSNVFCLNNNPAQVEQHFVKLCNYIKSQPEPIRRELSELVNPLLCHLYIEMLKGRDWRPAIEFLRKHAPLLGKVEPSVTPPGSSPLIMNQKINGTVEEQQQSGIPAATVQSSAIVYSPPATTSSTDCPQLDTFQQLVHKLSQITRIQDLENDELTLQFRSCQYEIRLCSASVVALRRYLAKYGHSLILQILRSWFCFETSDDKDVVDYSPDTATAKATGKRPRLSTSSNGLDGINGGIPAIDDDAPPPEPDFDFSEHSELENTKFLLRNGFNGNFIRFKIREMNGGLEGSDDHRNHQSLSTVDMDYDDDEDDGTGYLPALEDIPTKAEPPFPEEQPHDDISGLFRRISSAERLRKLRECTDKLAQYQLPMCIYQVENVDDRLTAVAIDGTSCHLASGFEDSSIMLWSVNRSTQIGRKPYAALRDRQCHWNVTACDSSFSEDEEIEEEDDGEEQQEDDEGGGRESDDPGEGSGLRNLFRLRSSAEVNRLNKLLPVYSRRLNKRDRWKQFMDRKCSDNVFTETGGVTLRGHSNAVTDLLFSAHTPLLLSVSRDLTMRAWQASDYNCRAVYRGHNHPIWSVAESPTGLYLATGSRDTTARLWCTDREFPLQIYVGHTQDVDTVAFHPNGNYLATGSTDLTVRLWCVTSGKLFRIFTDCRQPVNRISFSPDGKYLAAAGEENRVRIFDLAAGSQLTELREHSSPVTCVTWSANSRHFVSAGADGTVRVWDALKMVSTSSSSSSSSSTAAANNSPNPAANGAHNHTNHSQKTPTSSGSSSSSNNLLLAYSTGCRRIYRLHYNQLNGSLCCIGNS
uniref:TAF5-like RNA polymerase II p300/CBP-associated factor-associated factor 65 kDa subunit 5L n=1 Tax=Culex pipiens TaxID=7175 RepID=A0A8D8GB28_CULPI